ARGEQLDASALLDALDGGRLDSAILDVTDPEPLPAGHPFWTHPRIRITPHIASATRPDGAVDAVLANLARHRAGQPMIGVVDRARGY
ncbi:MAG: glyoxylate/hydroxypyruvate reductase A, partial [Burkholderia vietnamiensis]|nr:glyoxylate/hydroxypyruvate reductase A [Burkholderia vietnamiensis]